MLNLALILGIIVFPYISQNTPEAPYGNDCHSASVLMVAQYYEVADTETVKDVQVNMVGKGAPAKYPQIVDYLENVYGLKTQLITTYEPIKDLLVEAGFENADEIKVVDDIPSDVPVIWSYLVAPHWVVRYDGMNFDPIHGVYPFDKTSELRNLYRPDLGFGIIVTK